MTEKIKIFWVYLICVVFIALNSFLIAKEFYWLSLLPVAGVLLLMYLFALDKVLLLITFLTPFAVNIRDFDVGFGVSIPTEPLMAGVVIIFFLRLLYENNFDFRITRHPVTLAIIFNILWIFFTCITSEIPVVSFKFLAARLWFVIPFYFLGTQLFKNYKSIKPFTWLYIIALLGVIAYTINEHSKWDFDEYPAHWVMSPFYNDHTAYGAAIALFLPIVAGFAINRDYQSNIRLLSWIVIGILVIALILSYSRAAWLSVIGAAGVVTVVLLRIRFKWVLLGMVLIIGGLYLYQDQIVYKLEKNKQDSSTDFVEHVQSISNISTDASNLERINRWQAALRMFDERPLVGWGPGTYQFLYAPFQHSREKTVISTNAGELGNAHSEYISPLAETGIIGMLSFLVIIILTIYTALKVYKEALHREVKLLSLILLAGLITYYLHGFLNNFLESDKAAVPFWGFTAAIVALDVYHKRNSSSLAKESEKDEE